MNRAFLSLSLLALGGGVFGAGACTATTIPIGQEDAGFGGPGGVSCGSTTCGQGDVCCPGTDLYCTPTCTQGATCPPALGRACMVRPDAGSTGDAEPATDAEPAPDAASGNLRWYQTCGEPVCQAPESDAGIADADGGACPTVGSPCNAAGDACGTRNAAVACGSTEVCAAQDPKAGFAGCPVSSRSFKDGITYLDPAELKDLHDQTIGIRLATYNYKSAYADPNPRRLGFIIEDNPSSPAVDPAHDSIELYGYLSMVVATVKVQEKEIASLKRELAETRAAVRR